MSSIEEYQELRAEIRHYLSDSYTLRRFGFLVTLGVIGFGFENDSAHLLFIAGALMILFIWHERIRTLRNIFRVATYIEIFIEPDQADLHWESYSSKHDFDLSSSSKASRIYADLDLPVLYIMNATIGVVKLWSVHQLMSIVVSVLMIILLLLELRATSKAVYDGKEQERYR